MNSEVKIVGIMQPYFLPFFEQFRLIAACDLWVVFDTPQFSRKSWINRNRILNRDKGWAYVSVPVRHTGLTTSIQNTLIDCRQDWRGQIMDKLKVYQGNAPYYAVVRELIGSTLEAEYDTISRLNTALLRALCAYLGIDTPFVVASSFTIDHPEHCEPGEWALHIARHFGASEYRNASGGTELFDPSLYASHSITLSFHQHRTRSYATGSFTFVQDLSIVDWVMWNDPQTLSQWLD